MTRTIKTAKQQQKKLRDIYAQLILKNPRFKEAPKSGKGFVIVGAKSPRR
jgi:hypothetical protein